MRSYKNRITFFLDEEHHKSFRIFISTLEQVNICISFFKRCTDLDYLEYCFESCKGRVWAVENEEIVSFRRDIIDKRTAVAPFKLTVDLRKVVPAVDTDISIYFFSGFDADVLGMILSNGSDNLPAGALSYYCRDRVTHDWITRKPQALADKDLADVYNSLSSESKSLAWKYFKML